MAVWYFYSAFYAGQIRYGFNQLSRLGLPVAAGLIFVITGLSIIVRGRDTSDSNASEPIPVRKLLFPAFLSSVVLMSVFWFLRNGFINADGLFNMQSLISGVSILHHDEMLTSLFITRIWESGVFGLLPESSFSVFSVVWGGLFVVVMVILGGRLTGTRWPLFLTLCFSSGFVQLYFGDVEFYAMVATLSALYLLLVLEYLRGRISLILPAMVLGIAICSHLLAGWLLPSYLYLLIRGVRKKEYAQVSASVLLSILVVVFVFIIVTDAGLSIRSLSSSHAMGSADKGTLEMLAVPSLSYYASVSNLLFLLFPFWLMIPLMFVYRRFHYTPYDVVVGISLVMLLLLAFVWHLGLGPYFDWNLVATVGVPASILVWGNLLRGSWRRGMKTAIWTLLLVGALHSWTWIASNSLETSFLPRENMGPLLQSRTGSNLMIPEEYR